MRFKPNFQLEIADENNFALNISKIEAELYKYVNVGRFNSFDNTEIYYEYFLTEESKGSEEETARHGNQTAAAFPGH